MIVEESSRAGCSRCSISHVCGAGWKTNQGGGKKARRREKERKKERKRRNAFS